MLKMSCSRIKSSIGHRRQRVHRGLTQYSTFSYYTVMKHVAEGRSSHNPLPTTRNPPMTDDEFIRAFENCTLPETMFHHRDHLRLVWLYLGRHGRDGAQVRIARSILRYAASLGKAEKYHHTITLAWLKLVEHAVQ